MYNRRMIEHIHNAEYTERVDGINSDGREVTVELGLSLLPGVQLLAFLQCS